MARPSIRHVPATKAYCSGTSIHPPCSGNQGLLAPSNHRHMLRAPPIRAPPIQLCFSRVRRCQTAPALPTKWQPVGPESCWGSAVSHACSPATLAAVTCLWSGWCPTMLPRAVQCLPKLPAPALPTKWQPVGPESCWGSAVSHACSPAGLAAVTCLWSGWCPTMLPRAVTSTQPMPAKASSPTHPPLLLAGSKVLNGTGSADQVATRWA